MEQIIKEKFDGKGYELIPNYSNVSHGLLQLILKAKQHSYSEQALKMLLILSANLKERQIKKSSEDQLQMFDEEWEIDNNVDYSVQFAFRFSDFLPKGSKNYNQVKNGLEELRKIDPTVEFYKSDDQGRPRKFVLKSGIISSYLYEERRGFKIVINKFWYRVLINMTAGFNPYLKSILFNLNYNALIFYFKLQSLPIIKSKEAEYEFLKVKSGLIDKPKLSRNDNKGTQFRFDTFCELFNVNLKYESDIKKSLLEPIRNNLNLYSDISFNYSIKGKLIYVITYEVNHIITSDIDIDTEYIRIYNAIKYRIKNFNLTDIDIYFLIEVYLKYSFDIVKKATDKKTALKNLKGQDYRTTFIDIVDGFAKKKKLVADKNLNAQDIKSKLVNAFKLN